MGFSCSRSYVFSHQDIRKKYEADFVCEWAPSREHCRILYKSNLKELDTVPEPWHPTENMEAILKTHLKTFSTKKTLTNSLAVHDCTFLMFLPSISIKKFYDSNFLNVFILFQGSH